MLQPKNDWLNLHFILAFYYKIWYGISFGCLKIKIFATDHSSFTYISAIWSTGINYLVDDFYGRHAIPVTYDTQLVYRYILQYNIVSQSNENSIMNYSFFYYKQFYLLLYTT